MRVCLDTSVLVPALVPALPTHADAYAWIRAAFEQRIDAMMSWHAFAEAWSVLTRLPLNPPTTPAAAQRALQSLSPSIRRVPLDGGIYEAACERCSGRGLRSGAIFDALHIVCAEHEGAELFVTGDVADFMRLVDGNRLRIVALNEAPPAA